MLLPICIIGKKSAKLNYCTKVTHTYEHKVIHTYTYHNTPTQIHLGLSTQIYIFVYYWYIWRYVHTKIRMSHTITKLSAPLD